MERLTMFKSLAFGVGLAAVSACSDRAARLPLPAFTRTPGLPGFIVECRNTTDRPISRTDGPVKALRLDGVLIKSKGSLGSVPGGFPPDVPPGETWKHVVVLHPDSVTRTSSSMGLELGMLKTDWGVPLGKGRHTVAFQCAGEWTADVSFDW